MALADMTVNVTPAEKPREFAPGDLAQLPEWLGGRRVRIVEKPVTVKTHIFGQEMILVSMDITDVRKFGEPTSRPFLVPIGVLTRPRCEECGQTL